MSWAETKKINSDMAVPLNDLINAKNSVKIQTVSFTFGNNISPVTEYASIEHIDPSKSIILLTSYHNLPNTASISVGFNGNTQVFATRTPIIDTVGDASTISAVVITFGGEVERG